MHIFSGVEMASLGIELITPHLYLSDPCGIILLSQRQRGCCPLDNSDSSQQHSWHGSTAELLKINIKNEESPPPYSRECISHTVQWYFE